MGTYVASNASTSSRDKSLPLLGVSRCDEESVETTDVASVSDFIG